MTPPQEDEALPPPPPCYCEAVYDDDGYMVPVSSAVLMEDAGRWSEVRRREGLALMELYRQPTLEWAQGRENIIAARIAHATGSPEIVAVLEERLAAVGVDASGRPHKTPLELRFQILGIGLMEKAPSRVTRDAIAVFHPLGLYSLLTLDPVKPDSSASGPVEPRKEETQLRNFEELLPVMRELGGRILDPHVLRGVLTVLHKLLSARFVTEVSRANEAAEQLAMARSMISAHEYGWTKPGTQWRREKLCTLVNGLRQAEPGNWPLSRVVELLLASAEDWSHPPCPELVERYRDRPNAFEDLLKKDLRRSKRD